MLSQWNRAEVQDPEGKVLQDWVGAYD